MVGTLLSKRGVLLLGFVIAAFAVRLAVAVWLGISVPPAAGTDDQEYDTYAWNLAQGRGYRGMSPDVIDQDHLTAYRPPGPSLAWAALYTVFGHRYDVIRVTHCLFGALTVLLVFAIAQKVFNDRTAWLATFTWTFFPTSLLYSSGLTSESLTTLLLMGYLLASLWFANSPTWLRAIGTGLLLGMLILVHPTKLVMLPLAGIWGLWQFRGHRMPMLRAVLIPLIAIVPLVPWTARNYLVFGEFIPFSTMGGSALLQGNNRLVVSTPALYGYSVWDTEIPEYHDALRGANDEMKRDRLARTFAVEWLKDNVDQWPFLVQAKLRRGWTPFLQPNSPPLYRWGMLIFWGPILVLFAIAFFPTLFRLLRSGHPGWIIHLAILHFVIVTVIFFGNSRYRYPIEPLCVILAAVTCDHCIAKITGGQVKKWATVKTDAVKTDAAAVAAS